MPKPVRVHLTVLRDGVFVAEDVRKDKGERAYASPDVAQLLIERGHAKPV